MSEPVKSHAVAAAELRRAFDGGFAEAYRGKDRDFVDFLAVGAGGDAYALPVSELSGFVADRRIVWLPGPERGLLGVAGIRSSIVPVYALGALLGYPLRRDAPRWLVLVGTDQPVALGVESFGGCLHLPREAIAGSSDGEPSRAHVRTAVWCGESLVPVVDLMSVIDEIGRRARSSDSPRRDE